MKNITFEFACQDDCLEKMVPSDLRQLVAERDSLRAQLAERESEAVAWGYPNTALTGRSALMQVRLEIPSDDEYRGAHWIPLYTTPQPPAVPDGYVLVPNELTPVMREAYWKSQDDYEDGLTEMPDGAWRAMIAASGEGE